MIFKSEERRLFIMIIHWKEIEGDKVCIDTGEILQLDDILHCECTNGSFYNTYKTKPILFPVPGIKCKRCNKYKWHIVL